MSEHINIPSLKRIPSGQVKLRAANLLKIIAKAQERMRLQGKTWSVDAQNERGVDEKEFATLSVEN